LRGVSASWLGTAVSVGYSLASIPLALSYLSAEEFGLWMLAAQLGGYLSLLEFGLTGATARLLVDHKDDLKTGEYAATITASALVFAVQGVLIVALGLCVAAPLAGLFSIPSHLQAVAIHLIVLQAAVAAIGAFSRIFSSILYANQRLDLLMAVAAISQVVALVFIWIILEKGGGLWHLPWALVGSTILSLLAFASACAVKGLLPRLEQWKKPTWARLVEVGKLGRDFFLVNIGSQLLDASQILIVSRAMGLQAAAVWAVSTKIFTFIFQLLTKIEGTAIVFFSEMMVRKERTKLKERFEDIYQVTAGMSSVAVVAGFGINASFVTVWAGQGLLWSPTDSLLLALLTFINCILRCQTDVILVSKQIGAYRYINLFEGFLFVCIALAAAKLAGFAGILGTAIACALLLRGIYTVNRISEYFEVPVYRLAGEWLRRSFMAAVAFVPLIWLSHYFSSLLEGDWTRFVFNLIWCTLCAAAIFAFLAIPGKLMKELGAWFSESFGLRRV